MRLALVTGVFPSTSQAFITRKVVALKSKGHSVTVISTSPGPEDCKEMTPGLEDVTVRYLAGFKRSKFALLLLTLARALSAPRFTFGIARIVWARHGFRASCWRRLPKLLLLSGLKADVIHFEWATKAVELEDVLPMLATPVIVSCRGTDLRIIARSNPSSAEALRRVLSSADAVHCVSDDLRAAAARLGVPAGKVCVIRTGIDTRVFSPRISEGIRTPVRLVTVGRLHWVKGHEYAVAAVRHLRDRGVDVRYTIAGPAEPQGEAALRLAISDLGLEDVVEVQGAKNQTEVAMLLARSDIYLAASLSEGINNAVLEAMAVGLPVVVTDVGGMREAVTDQANGLLVPSRNPSRMAEAVQRLVDNPRLAAAMGEAGRQRVMADFDLQRHLSEFTSLYATVGSRASSAASLCGAGAKA